MSTYRKVLTVFFCMLVLFALAPTGGANAQTEGPFGDPTCGDFIDNDGDGKKDSADTDCYNNVGDPDVDDDGDGRTENAGDCNDDDPTIYSGAQKICDGKDNNCDGKKDFTTDEDKDTDGVPWCAGDCDDNNPNRAPNIIEAPMGSAVCLDGIDNDCDNKADSVDPGCQFSCFDSDGDGYGINGDASCDFPGEIDCNDNNATINPGVVDDSCNGTDNNCSGTADDQYVIDDLCGDGECETNNTPSSCVAGVETLCQPGLPVYEGPTGDATCTGGLDEDCDTLIDGNDPGCNTLCIDADGDGYGANGHASCPNGPAVDCDDTNPAIHPGGDDTNCNGIDEDCVSGADSGYVPDTLCGTGLCQSTNTSSSCTAGVETACQPGTPVAEDTPGVGVCTDGVDNDCDGLTDAADSEGCSSLDVDDDGDGVTENQGDCNDGDATMYPGAPKICDGKDNNCDGKKDFTTDEDKDNDGVPWCAQDCDDNNPNRAPNLFEGGFNSAICTDGIDNDCDNKIDFADPPCQGDCIDADGDGYGVNGDVSCDVPNMVDCDDTNPAVHPGGDDANCNGIDEDCTGGADSGYIPDTLCGTGECQTNNTLSTCVGGVETACQPGTPVLEGPQGDPTCSGGLDEDCDDLIDGNDPGCNTLCIDQDGDGYGANGHASCPNGPALDCDDSNAAVNPAGNDANCNGIDEDCVGGADSGYVVDALCGTGECQTNNTPSSCTGGVETLCQPGAPVPEDTPFTGVCIDGLDNDCDGSTDAFDSDCSNEFEDNDGDGFCRATSCTDGSSPNDCDDTDPNVYPGAPKICDGKDSNCDGKKDSPTDEDKDNDGVPWCAGDCDDNNDQAYPGNTEGPFGDPTCSDGIDNDCQNGTDAIDPVCVVSCETSNDTKDGPHVTTLMAPGPDGLPNTGDDIIHPENNNLLCGKCHGATLQDPIRYACDRCHEAGGTSKAAYPDPLPFGFGSAPDVQVHSSTVVGTKYGAWDMDCVTCHNPHLQEQDGAFGTSYGKYIKEYICFDNPVTAINVEEIVEFTAASGTGSFADGPPYNENICNMCHTQTNHHRREDAAPAPGGQDHNNGQDCAGCHPHIDGFAPSGGVAAAPHDTGRFLSECDLCHVSVTDFTTPVPDAKCEQCHTQAGAEKPNFPTAPNVLTHADFNNPGSAYTYTNACIDCHDPMFNSGAPNQDLIRSTIAGSVLGGVIDFTAYSGPGSFADGPPYPDNICNTCHSMTNHHQADGIIEPPNPGPQDHNNETDCRACHAHDNAFIPDIAVGPIHAIVTDCNICHVSPVYSDPVPNTACEQCHTLTGALKGSYPTAPDVVTHMGRECVECHDPMFESGLPNLDLIRSTIAGSITPGSTITFTSYTGINSFGNGPPYNENICDTCHSLTNHHQSDGDAPGGQEHENGSDCRSCHDHNDPAGAWAAPNIMAASPHNGITDCNLCHVNGRFSDPVPNSQCANCHTPTGSAKGSYPTAPNVNTHMGRNCIECHDPMYASTLNLDIVRETIAGSIVPGSTITFTSYSGAGSFADGAPYNENICETCHSATNHHQSDGDAPGGQDHENNSDCRACHDHNGPVNAFAAPVIPVSAPHDAVTDCYACHVGNFADPIPNSQCEQCHTQTGALKGSYPTAPDVLTHQGGTCIECHNPMDDQTNINHVRSMIAGSITPGSNIVFTTRTLTGSFADGPPYNENVCNTCHSATNHHQSDGDAPGGQDHENGSDCTTCHDHNGPVNAFAAPNIVADAPHDVITDCTLCHTGPNFADPVPNTACDNCHTPTGAEKINYPSAPDVATHAGTSYGPFSKECVDCHNPMYPQTNQQHVRTDMVLAGGANNVVFPPYVVAASPWNGVCENCHTMTNHHQNDGTALGGQSHNDTAVCTDCHPHLDGFLPTGANVPMPHDAQLCNTCHVAEPDYSAVIPDTACLTCHDESAPVSGNLYQVDNFVGLTTGAAGRPTFGNWTGIAGSDGTNGWMVWTGPTSSAGTGPSAGNPVEYVVLESSATTGGADADPTNGANVIAGSSQYLVSNVIDASIYAIRFAFDWNMNVGDNIDASLHLDAWNGTAWDLDVTGGPINTGNNNDVWVTEGPIDLSAYTNVDFQLRIRYIVGTGTTYQNDVAVDNLIVLGAGGGAGSDLKVMTHADTVNPPRPYTYSNTCVGCHNPMYPQQNLAFIRQTIAGSVLGGTINFTQYTGAGSFADGPPYPDNICNTCHSLTQHHQADGSAPGGQDHNNGADCAQCHPHLEGFQPQGGCTICHSQSPPIGSSDPDRRQIVEMTPGDGQGDFVKSSHHVTDDTTNEIVTDDDCIVCHDQSSHQSFGDGQTVLLNDQDGGASYTYDGTGASIEGFCVSCHDTDGSLLNGSQPFIASGDTNSPPDVGWSVGVVSHSTFDVCFNCHAQGHGSDFEKILAEDNEPGLCFNCHDADGPASTDIDFRFAQQFGHPVTAANSSIHCLDCHNPHQAEPGTHTPDGQWYPSSPDANTNLVSGVLSGVMGVEPSPWAPAWTKTDSYTVLDSAEKEYQICFKCHARYSHQYSQDCFMCHPMTWDPDLGAIVAGFKFRSAQREFNINNKSAHPVAVTSNNQSGSYAPNALSSSQMEAPWTNVGNQTMYCSDCHGAENEDGGDPRGPHGSDKPFMLKGPNTMWPAGSVRLFSLNDISGQGEESRNTNWGNELFCLNCHDSFPSSNKDTWKNEVHIEHDDRDYEPTGGNKKNLYCIACHAIVPHGSHVSRLITYRTELPEYNTYNDVNYNVIEGFRKTSRFTYDKENCRTVSNLGCDKHDDYVNSWD